MKKYVSSILCMLTLCTSTMALWSSLGDINVEFCNESIEKGSKSLNLQMNENEQKNICMKVSNVWNEKAEIMLGFVDGTITNDSDQKKACKNEGENQNFGKFVEWKNESFEIPANSTIIRNANIQFPTGYAGTIPGCVTYYIAGDNAQGNNMFKIIMRKANFIDVFVSGTITVWLEMMNMSVIEDSNVGKNISHTPEILAYIDPYTKQLNIEYGVKNYGSVKQAFTVKGTISNPFGYSYSFEDTNKTVVAKEEVRIHKTLDNIPTYKGPFTITLQVEHQAVFDFESSAISDELKKVNSIQVSSDIFLTPRRIIQVIILIAIIIIILRIISQSKKIKNNVEKKKEIWSKKHKTTKNSETSTKTKESTTKKKSTPKKEVKSTKKTTSKK